jgi:hypothetical protein
MHTATSLNGTHRATQSGMSRSQDEVKRRYSQATFATEDSQESSDRNIKLSPRATFPPAMTSEEHIAELLRNLELAEADRNAVNARTDREASRANRAEAERGAETARADREAARAVEAKFWEAEHRIQLNGKRDEIGRFVCSLTLYDDRYGDDASVDPIPVAQRELEEALNDLGGDNTSMPDLDDLPPQPPLVYQAPPPLDAIYQVFRLFRTPAG